MKNKYLKVQGFFILILIYASGGAAEFSRLRISSAQYCVFMFFVVVFLPLFLHV